MKEEKDINQIIKEHEIRLSNIEKELGIENEFEEKKVEEKVIEKKEKSVDMPSFTQTITILGIIGIIIALVSFYFYAVANEWIGQTGQIIIGLITGFVLFFISYILKEKRKIWSEIVFGGSYFIQNLSIAIAVLSFKIMNPTLGLILSIFILIIAMTYAITNNSRSAAYITLIGSYLIPYITNNYSSLLFIMSYYLILNLTIIFLSYYKNWADFRFVSFILVFLFTNGNYRLLIQNRTLSVIFLISLFIIYHLISIINSLKSKKDINSLDIITLIGSTVAFLPMINILLKVDIIIIGFIVMLFSMIYLIEIAYIKNKNYSITLEYSLLSAGIVLLNIGLVFILSKFNFLYFLIPLTIQWILFTFFRLKKENSLYKTFSYICLGLIGFFYLRTMTRFYLSIDITTETIFLILLAAIVYHFYKFSYNDIDKNFYGIAFIIGGFYLIYKLTQYLNNFIQVVEIYQILLSVLWLTYTLILFKNTETKDSKIIIYILIGITILKIAFVDLLYLQGAARIIGFLIFGILLLIGGYLIKK